MQGLWHLMTELSSLPGWAIKVDNIRFQGWSYKDLLATSFYIASAFKNKGDMLKYKQ